MAQMIPGFMKRISSLCRNSGRIWKAIIKQADLASPGRPLIGMLSTSWTFSTTAPRTIAMCMRTSQINSDQGSQFTSDDYKSLLKSLHIRQSMDGKSRWTDNIMIERWFRSLKTEKIYIEEYATERELRACIDGFIDQYNNMRPHESLDNATLASVYAASFAA